MLKLKTVSSLEKVFLTDDLCDKQELRSITAAKGERVSFQIMMENQPEDGKYLSCNQTVSVRSRLSRYIKLFRVGNVPSELPAYLDRSDDDYITKTPGMFPDVLYPVNKKEIIRPGKYSASALWVTVELPRDIEAGDYRVSITLADTVTAKRVTARVIITVKNTVIADNDLIYTEWFHCDSIADYFGVKMMSARHWKLIEQFIKTAAHTGITMLLTPLFTPPLDTEVGSERPTMQLVRVTKTGEKYSFDFDLLDKWVGLCKKYGINRFEMSHLFTQWGVECCPKIVVNVNGTDEKLFGWHTAADGDMYKEFLSQLLPELTAHLKKLGIADNCYFHISDEPSVKPERNDFENYLKAKQFIAPFLKGFKMMDALSSIEFYDNGLVDYPVCSTNHIEPFMERDIKERWCYYCCSQGDKVSNRFLAMPSYRNRIIGVQMYLNDISGFLQWGYNFYYTAHAVSKINPFAVTDGGQAWPSGDPFSVYPYEDKAIESLRAVVFYEGIQDRILLKMLENKIGKAKTTELVKELAGTDITFKEYPRNSEFIIALHDKILEILG